MCRAYSGEYENPGSRLLLTRKSLLHLIKRRVRIHVKQSPSRHHKPWGAERNKQERETIKKGRVYFCLILRLIWKNAVIIAKISERMKAASPR